MNDKKVAVIEGVTYDPVLDSGRWAVKTDDGEYVYIESELPYEGTRVRVTIEVLDVAALNSGDAPDHSKLGASPGEGETRKCPRCYGKGLENQDDRPGILLGPLGEDECRQCGGSGRVPTI